jgi:hypothetical protein
LELAAGGEEANEISDHIAADRREDEALIALAVDQSGTFKVVKVMRQGWPRQIEEALDFIHGKWLACLDEAEEDAQAIKVSESFERRDILRASLRGVPLVGADRNAHFLVCRAHTFEYMKIRN